MRRLSLWAGLGAAFIVVGIVAARLLLLPGLSSARRTPPAAEVAIATWLLHASVPTGLAAQVNAIPAADGAIAEGSALFQRHCATCHGFDGHGHTQIGRGEYPQPPPLQGPVVAALSDGEIFYHIRNGIRNTGMPAFDLPDGATWHLVLAVRHLPPVAADVAASVLPADAHYVGSAVCASCHKAIYDRWRTTRMANVVRDPATHPEAVIPDFSKPDPLLTFTLRDVALVYGSRWKQRYFRRSGTSYTVLPAQWDITHHRWLPFFVKADEDWWATLYPPDNAARPTGPLCDGCHSVGYDLKTGAVTEWNVGCERCHGPGSAHVARPVRATILNPARLDDVAANDTCVQCHSQGRPIGNPIDGHYVDWPVGFAMGGRLADHWTLEARHPGQTNFYYFPDGTAHKNRMQGNDYVQSLMYTRGVTCFSCHDPHGSDNVAMLRARGNDMCLSCHAPGTATGPRAASIEAHTHHRADSPGSACVACHMPAIETELGSVKVHAHTFRFIPPAQTIATGEPNACTLCHTDRTPAWASAALASWPDRSPWRDAP